MASLLPKLNKGKYVFCFSKEEIIMASPPLATFREEEGLTYVISTIKANQLQLPFEEEWAWISLGFYSDLNMVGLTASFSKALTEEGISCNVVAAFHHDHIFVPIEKADQALKILNSINI